MSPEDAREKLTPLFAGSMRGRTMYVVPFLMGPPGSPYSKVGVEITHSRYVVLSMRIMTRVGQPALDHLGESATHPAVFTRSAISVGPALHRALSGGNAVWSIGSGYGGGVIGENALAARELPGAPRLARRAHAHRRVPLQGWPGAVHRRGVSLCLRQDQHGNARAAGLDARLEGMDRWR
jgi:hypothetical protein